jgi:hypothetical protein
MKLYAIEFDLTAVKETEHRLETFTDISKFIDRVKYLEDKYYVENMKVYSGEISEINIDKVLNPF